MPERSTQQRVAEFLERQGFSVARTETVEDGQPMLRAAADACRLLVAKSPVGGWDRDLIRRHATSAERVFVVFRGKVYVDQPTWLTVPDFLWARFRRELGTNAQPAPVLAIIATTTCEAERLPWHELASTR
jgi:hypothetical protein